MCFASATLLDLAPVATSLDQKSFFGYAFICTNCRPGSLIVSVCLSVCPLSVCHLPFVTQALEGLRNRSGWQISRDDDLKVAYQHVAGEHLFVVNG